MIVPLSDDITFMVRSMRYRGHILKQHLLLIVPVHQMTFPDIAVAPHNLPLKHSAHLET